MSENIESKLQEISHNRYNILTGEWILVSPHRAKRPWQGKHEDFNITKRPNYDEDCYLCAGNKRANGIINPDYKDVFSFVNDFSALQEHSNEFHLNDGLLIAESERGMCKVVCFSPDHSKSLAEIPINDIQQVIKTWQSEYIELGHLSHINYVQIFENKGQIMGCSNPHPHGQIWSQSTLPNEILKKDKKQFEYYQENNSSLLGDYMIQELKKGDRIVYENKAFVILTPFWSIWPYETMIVPKLYQKNIVEMTSEEIKLFAEAISVITRIYDRLFACSFPYSSGIHQAPTNNKKNDHWHWHMSFYPPLLRSAAVKKFMVGYEMFASPQRDFTPEAAADTLRNLVKELN